MIVVARTVVRETFRRNGCARYALLLCISLMSDLSLCADTIGIEEAMMAVNGVPDMASE